MKAASILGAASGLLPSLLMDQQLTPLLWQLVLRPHRERLTGGGITTYPYVANKAKGTFVFLLVPIEEAKKYLGAREDIFLVRVRKEGRERGVVQLWFMDYRWTNVCPFPGAYQELVVTALVSTKKSKVVDWEGLATIARLLIDPEVSPLALELGLDSRDRHGQRTAVAQAAILYGDDVHGYPKRPMDIWFETKEEVQTFTFADHGRLVLRAELEVAGLRDKVATIGRFASALGVEVYKLLFPVYVTAHVPDRRRTVGLMSVSPFWPALREFTPGDFLDIGEACRALTGMEYEVVGILSANVALCMWRQDLGLRFP